MAILSPLTGTNNVELLERIDSRFVIDGYRDCYKIDVERYFKGERQIYLYRCNETGYKFYHPSLPGDGNFYAEMQRYPWYYVAWKWEHEKALEAISNHHKVLEVGSAKGDFLKRLKDRGNEVVGLETNPQAANEAREKGITVYEEYLESFAKRGINDFDAVCFFQVLEHIYDVRGAISNALAILKVGGTLIISVPNDDSFIGEDKRNYLNMPPHHAGLWNEVSLTSLARIFELTLEPMALEPLQKYHFGYYYQVKAGYKLRKCFGLPGRIVNRIALVCVAPLLAFFSSRITGHSILAIYRKGR